MSVDSLPLVTVGIPNYNYSHYISGALNSVINQTYPNIELIIVDDLSTDNSVAVIEDWIEKYKGPVKIKFIKNTKNGGLTKVCNQVLKNATGKYFQTLDADDILLTEKISTQVEKLERGNNVAFIYSNIGVINEKGEMMQSDYLKRIGYDKANMPVGNIHEALFNFNFIPLPSVLVNTEMARAAGGFDETLQVQDYYMWLKLSEKHNALYIPGNTALYRVHGSSMSNSTKTNPRSVDSVLNIKYRYYKDGSAGIKKKIRNDIHLASVYLYEHKVPSAGLWLKRDFLLNPGIKPLGYLIAINLGIPFSVFALIKKKLFNQNKINAA